MSVFVLTKLMVASQANQIEILVTISLKLLKYNLTPDKGGCNLYLKKPEHAISGARHLHNEDTSISASNVFDSLQRKAMLERSEKCR